MGRRICILAILALAGCKTSDGEACEDDDECGSGYCFSGYCAGSECAEDGDCEDGWDCRHVDPNFVEVIGNEVGDFFTGDDDDAEGSYVCRARCGECPPNQTCNQGDEYCIYAPP